MSYPRNLLNNIKYYNKQKDEWLFGKFHNTEQYTWSILGKDGKIKDFGLIQVKQNYGLLLRFIMELIKDGWHEVR